MLDAETQLIGSTMGGYTIESVLGEGGMATVYLATLPGLKQQVALKVLSAEISNDPAFRERFIREAHVTASLTHPNVIPIYDAGESGGVPWIAMGYAEGGDLDKAVREGRLPLVRTIVIVEQVASALDAAHAASLLHLDVNTRNILLGAAGHVYLSDFGMARRLGGPYPPQARQMTSADNWRDIHALGHVAYRCLAGRPPYMSPSIKEDGRGLPPALSILRPGLPVTLDDVLAKAMAWYPDVHYRTAGAMASAFRLAGLGTQSSRITLWPHLADA